MAKKNQNFEFCDFSFYVVQQKVFTRILKFEELFWQKQAARYVIQKLLLPQMASIKRAGANKQKNKNEFQKLNDKMYPLCEIPLKWSCASHSEFKMEHTVQFI